MGENNNRNELNTKLKLLLKTEQALFSLELQNKSRQAVLVAVGLICVLTSLVMINVSIYLFFENIYSSQISAVILTIINLSIALLFFAISKRQNTAAEAKALQEMRDYALEQISDEIDEVKQNAEEFKNSINRIKNSVDSIATGDFLGLKMILPIVQTFFSVKKDSDK